MGQKAITKNTLFYGDNLDIMRQYMADESVDLIYLDPPFNSNRNYNVLYKDESGLESEAQILAFKDTWHWTRATDDQYHALAAVGDMVGRALENLVDAMGRNQLTAYLVMMTARLVELHRVLKPTGSLYLHCDPTASHYLKVILDMIFDTGNFRNEIIWHYRKWAIRQQQFVSNHDIIFFYSKLETKARTFNQLFMERSDTTLKRFGKSKIVSGHDETGKRLPSKTESSESEGVPLDDVWDIGRVPPIQQLFPTQKPLALLERIIQASSNPGDIVLDPFCGCGTAVHAAQKLGRTWIGIDVTYLATTIIKSRLYDAFEIEAKKYYNLIGEPTTLTEARHLATQDRYQFQWWALGLIPARPQGGHGDSKEGKKGKDRGIDGIMTFQDDPKGHHKRIIIQVKSGKVKPGDIRDLIGTMDSEKAAIGVFVTLEPPSQEMEIAALNAGKWHSDTFNRDYPRIQILTIEELLAGTKAQFPGTDTTLAKAQREQEKQGEQGSLL